MSTMKVKPLGAALKRKLVRRVPPRYIKLFNSAFNASADDFVKKSGFLYLLLKTVKHAMLLSDFMFALINVLMCQYAVRLDVLLRTNEGKKIGAEMLKENGTLRCLLKVQEKKDIFGRTVYGIDSAQLKTSMGDTQAFGKLVDYLFRPVRENIEKNEWGLKGSNKEKKIEDLSSKISALTTCMRTKAGRVTYWIVNGPPLAMAIIDLLHTLGIDTEVLKEARAVAEEYERATNVEGTPGEKRAKEKEAKKAYAAKMKGLYSGDKIASSLPDKDTEVDKALSEKYAQDEKTYSVIWLSDEALDKLDGVNPSQAWEIYESLFKQPDGNFQAVRMGDKPLDPVFPRLDLYTSKEQLRKAVGANNLDTLKTILKIMYDSRSGSKKVAVWQDDKKDTPRKRYDESKKVDLFDMPGEGYENLGYKVYVSKRTVFDNLNVESRKILTTESWRENLKRVLGLLSTEPTRMDAAPAAAKNTVPTNATSSTNGGAGVDISSHEEPSSQEKSQTKLGDPQKKTPGGATNPIPPTHLQPKAEVSVSTASTPPAKPAATGTRVNMYWPPNIDLKGLVHPDDGVPCTEKDAQDAYVKLFKRNGNTEGHWLDKQNGLVAPYFENAVSGKEKYKTRFTNEDKTVEDLSLLELKLIQRVFEAIKKDSSISNSISVDIPNFEIFKVQKPEIDGITHMFKSVSVDHVIDITRWKDGFTREGNRCDKIAEYIREKEEVKIAESPLPVGAASPAKPELPKPKGRKVKILWKKDVGDEHLKAYVGLIREYENKGYKAMYVSSPAGGKEKVIAPILLQGQGDPNSDTAVYSSPESIFTDEKTVDTYGGKDLAALVQAFSGSGEYIAKECTFDFDIDDKVCSVSHLPGSHDWGMGLRVAYEKLMKLKYIEEPAKKAIPSTEVAGAGTTVNVYWPSSISDALFKGIKNEATGKDYTANEAFALYMGLFASTQNGQKIGHMIVATSDDVTADGVTGPLVPYLTTGKDRKSRFALDGMDVVTRTLTLPQLQVLKKVFETMHGDNSLNAKTTTDNIVFKTTQVNDGQGGKKEVQVKVYAGAANASFGKGSGWRGGVQKALGKIDELIKKKEAAAKAAGAGAGTGATGSAPGSGAPKAGAVKQHIVWNNDVGFTEKHLEAYKKLFKVKESDGNHYGVPVKGTDAYFPLITVKNGSELKSRFVDQAYRKNFSDEELQYLYDIFNAVVNGGPQRNGVRLGNCGTTLDGVSISKTPFSVLGRWVRNYSEMALKALTGAGVVPSGKMGAAPASPGGGAPAGGKKPFVPHTTRKRDAKTGCVPDDLALKGKPKGFVSRDSLPIVPDGQAAGGVNDDSGARFYMTSSTVDPKTGKTYTAATRNSKSSDRGDEVDPRCIMADENNERILKHISKNGTPEQKNLSCEVIHEEITTVGKSTFAGKLFICGFDKINTGKILRKRLIADKKNDKVLIPIAASEITPGGAPARDPFKNKKLKGSCTYSMCGGKHLPKNGDEEGTMKSSGIYPWITGGECDGYYIGDGKDPADYNPNKIAIAHQVPVYSKIGAMQEYDGTTEKFDDKTNLGQLEQFDFMLSAARNFTCKQNAIGQWTGTGAQKPLKTIEMQYKLRLQKYKRGSNEYATECKKIEEEEVEKMCNQAVKAAVRGQYQGLVWFHRGGGIFGGDPALWMKYIANAVADYAGSLYVAIAVLATEANLTASAQGYVTEFSKHKIAPTEYIDKF